MLAPMAELARLLELSSEFAFSNRDAGRLLGAASVDLRIRETGGLFPGRGDAP
jgi:hypothetical protein